MPSALIPVALLLVVLPAAYAWWSGRRILRSLDDPALADLLQARQRRVAQVAVFAMAVSVLAIGLHVAILALLGVLVAQYPIRREVFGDEWSLPQYIVYSSASFLASAGLVIFALLAPAQMAKLVRAWIPGRTLPSFGLALALGVLCAVVVLVWSRYVTRIWLWLNRASPLETDPAHAALLPRLNAVLDRAGDRLARRPSIHRFGVKGGRIANAFAIPSRREPAVAMSDTLLDTLDADETTAIFAHEVAHHEYFDAARLRTRGRGFIIVALLVALLPVVLIVQGPDSDLGVTIVYLFVLGSLVAGGQAPKQHQETASDLRAIELTNDPEALIRALTKIHLLARQPRRLGKEIEHASTHPSLARRIQAIRAHAKVEPAALDTPTVIASTKAGSFVGLASARAHWLDGVAEGTGTDRAALRERASSYRAMTYRELTELRLVSTRGQRALRATDLAGQSWSVDVRDADVAVVESALDAVDSRFGVGRPQPVVQREGTARTLAFALLIAALLGGGTMVVTIPALVTLIAPSTASLAALGAMGATGLLLLGTSDSFGMPREMGAVLAAGALGLGVAWLAWTWYRARRETAAPRARLAARIMFALLVLGALATLLMVNATWTSPRDLAADENALSLAITLCGLGAALLTLRTTALRLSGAGTALLGVAALVAVALGDKLSPTASAIEWGNGELALVATVPLSGDVDAVALSPGGTRYLTRSTYGNGDVDDDDAYRALFTTGDVAQNARPYTVSALDAVLPNESELLVLAASGDSLELRLERVPLDSVRHVVWRRAFGKVYAPTLRLLDGGTRWQVSGMRIGERRIGAFVTLDGAVDPNPADADIGRAELTADTLRGQPVFAFHDGSQLVMSLAHSRVPVVPGRSVLWTTLTALRGINVKWQLSRQDGTGAHLLTSLHGAVRCWPSSDEDVAACVDQSARGVHVLRVPRSGAVVDLGTLARNYQRASVSPQGQLVASSYTDRSLAVIDVVRKRGLRIALPTGSGSTTRDATATRDALAVLLSGEGGSRLVVYRFGPLIETAGR
jgi:heat shock protein HtpX